MFISKQVEKLFEQAQTLAVEKRADFLNSSCTNELALREEVETLLAAAEKSESFFDDFSNRIQHVTLEPDQSQTRHIKLIGDWNIIRMLGSGGMGSVYLAERADNQYQHKVALKILPFGVGDAISRFRFQGERQILSRLTHDNIARFLDGGVTDEGTPYFVMEYVDGMDVDQYCIDNQLTIIQRLRLFLKICDAIEYAHRNMVVHRDIKPANILVGNNGQIKLLDFGIAKMMDASNPTAELTQAVSRRLTRNYASPEMLRGEAVDVTTDVYSLGVLLYQLLSGHKPFENFDTVAEFEKAVLNDATRKPSELQQESKLAKKIRGDLDTIILKALKKMPVERYSSVENFADDIKRYLSGHAVKARPDTAAYQLRKFIYRHRLMVGFVSFAIVMLIAVTTLSINYAITTSEQLKIIAKERDKAETIQSFLVDIFEEADPDDQTPNLSALDIVDRGFERVNSKLNDQPEVKVELLETFASIYRGFRLPVKSLSAQQSALDLNEKIYGKQSKQYVDALLRMAETLDISGDYSKSSKNAEQAISFGRLIDYWAGMAHGYQLKARIQHLQGEYSKAKINYRHALEFNLEEYGENSLKTAMTLSHLGSLMDHMGNYSRSETFFKRSIKTRKRLLGNKHIEVGASLLGMGSLLTKQTKYPEALEAYQQALEIFNENLGEDNSYNSYAYGGMGYVYETSGDMASARVAYKKNLSLLKVHSPGSPNQSMSLANVAGTYLHLNQCTQAIPLFREALLILNSDLPEHWVTQKTSWKLGSCLIRQQQFTEAEPLIINAVKRLINIKGKTHQATQGAVNAAVELYQAWGKPVQQQKYAAMLEASNP